MKKLLILAAAAALAGCDCAANEKGSNPRKYENIGTYEMSAEGVGVTIYKLHDSDFDCYVARESNHEAVALSCVRIGLP